MCIACIVFGNGFMMLIREATMIGKTFDPITGLGTVNGGPLSGAGRPAQKVTRLMGPKMVRHLLERL